MQKYFCYKIVWNQIFRRSFHDRKRAAVCSAASRLHNNRNGESQSCGHEGSEEMVEELRKVAKERNLKGIRLVSSGCLDVCAFGPNMVVWPEGLWCMKVIKKTCRRSSKST
jgi:hypothetical protein